MAYNDFQQKVEKETPKNVEGINGLDTITALQAQFTSLKKQLGTFNVSAIQLQPQVCDLRGGCHFSGDCQVEQANYLNNF